MADRDELRATASGNDRSSTLSTVVESLLRRARAGGSRRQCVNQRTTRDAERPDERRREHRVDRAHVRDDGGGARPPRELARERRLEAEAAPGLGATRGRGGRGSSRAARPSTAPSASTTTSSTSAASARSLATVAPSTGLRRVDLLRDEDEPHALRASTARSTSSATRSAYSSGVYVQAAERARPPSPSRSASARSERIRTSASAISSRPVGIDEEARLAVRDDVRDPAGPRADDGPAAAEGLEHDPRRPLRARGEQEHPRVVERLHHVRASRAVGPT